MRINMRALVSIMLIGIVSGCATNLTKPKRIPQPASVRLGSFANVELRPVTISELFAASEVNQKATKQIAKLLQIKLAEILPNLNSSEKEPGSTLVIAPVVKEIKFIGSAARFWAGALAGSSAVLMEVTYQNKETGTVVAQAEFYDQADSTVGAWSMGAYDNLMLNRIAARIVNYTRANQ